MRKKTVLWSIVVFFLFISGIYYYFNRGTNTQASNHFAEDPLRQAAAVQSPSNTHESTPKAANDNNIRVNQFRLLSFITEASTNGLDYGNVLTQQNGYVSRMLGVKSRNDIYYVTDGPLEANGSELYASRGLVKKLTNNLYIFESTEISTQNDIITGYAIVLMNLAQDKVTLVDSLFSKSKMNIDIINTEKAELTLNLNQNKYSVHTSAEGMHISENTGLEKELHGRHFRLRKITGKLVSFDWLTFNSNEMTTEKKLVEDKNKELFAQIRTGQYGIKDIGLRLSSFDMDFDKQNDIVALIQHPYITGAKANSSVVLYTLQTNKIVKEIPIASANIIFEKDGSQADIGVFNDLKSNGFKAILIGHKIYKWDGKAYQETK